MIRTLTRGLKRLLLAPAAGELARLQTMAGNQLLLAAQSEVRRVRGSANVRNLREVEFRVFSQWGEDGILQYLLGRVPVNRELFVELGVEDYRESNTRFLLMQNNWRGLVVDAGRENIESIRRSDLYWRHELTGICSFITRANVNDLIRQAGFEGDVGLLSIDIDGNDYWVWQAIDIIRPRIVICEYNSVFGRRSAITVPYQADFRRSRAHHSNLYFGASLPALCRLAEAKGYVFAGSNSAGCNAFFVLEEFSEGIHRHSADEGYVYSLARESRDRRGHLTHASGADRLSLIRSMPVYDIDRNVTIPLSETVE